MPAHTCRANATAQVRAAVARTPQQRWIDDNHTAKARCRGSHWKRQRMPVTSRKETDSCTRTNAHADGRAQQSRYAHCYTRNTFKLQRGAAATAPHQGTAARRVARRAAHRRGNLAGRRHTPAARCRSAALRCIPTSTTTSNTRAHAPPRRARELPPPRHRHSTRFAPGTSRLRSTLVRQLQEQHGRRPAGLPRRSDAAAAQLGTRAHGGAQGQRYTARQGSPSRVGRGSF
jgi:hypothetical protein